MIKEVNAMFNLKNKKTRKILSTIVIVILVLAMVLPIVLGPLLSIFECAGAESTEKVCLACTPDDFIRGRDSDDGPCLPVCGGDAAAGNLRG